MDNQAQRTIWQVSGGPTTRSYADIFLKYGVGLIASASVKVDTPERMLATARSWKARGARYIIFGKDCGILAETYETVVSTFRDVQL